jgi:hypothetical protein
MWITCLKLFLTKEDFCLNTICDDIYLYSCVITISKIQLLCQKDVI